MAFRGSSDELKTMTYYHFYVMQYEGCFRCACRWWYVPGPWQPKHAKTIFNIVGTVPGILVYIYIYNIIYEYVRVCIYIYICVCTLGPDRNDRRSPEAPAHWHNWLQRKTAGKHTWSNGAVHGAVVQSNLPQKCVKTVRHRTRKIRLPFPSHRFWWDKSTLELVLLVHACPERCGWNQPRGLPHPKAPKLLQKNLEAVKLWAQS